MLKAEVDGTEPLMPDFDTNEGNQIIEPKKILLNSYGGYGSDGPNDPNANDDEGGFGQSLKNKFKTAGEFMGKQGESIKRGVGDIRNKVEASNINETVKTGFWGGFGKLKAVGGLIGQKTTEVYNTSKEGIKKARTKINEKGAEVFDGLGDKTKENFAKFGEKTKDGWDFFSSKTKDGVSKIKDIGIDLYVSSLYLISYRKTELTLRTRELVKSRPLLAKSMKLGYVYLV